MSSFLKFKKPLKKLMTNKLFDSNLLKEKSVIDEAQPNCVSKTTSNTEKLLHELQTYQHELEMQNEELRSAYTELEISRDRYQDLYDFSPVAYLTVTPNNLIAEINMTAIKLLGLEVRKSKPNYRFPAFISPQDSDRWYVFFRGILKDKDRKNIRLLLKRIDGSEFLSQLTCQYLQANLRIAFTDLTELKHAEVALKKGLKEAKRKIDVKSQFLAMMSHEIRTPLNAILGMQELLTHTRLDNTQKEYLQTAALAGNNLLAIINDILDLTKVEAGKLDLEAIPFNVIELTQLCVQLVSVMAQAKELKLITIIDPELTPWISGDPLRFRQVLLNLLSNAIKFTEQGSVTVTLSSYASTDSACALLVEVIDTGIGIPENLQAGLFEVFVQVDPSDTRKYGGSGLGLAISKRLVTLWGGQIGIDSTPYVGSRFWFTFGTLAEAPKQPIIPTIMQDDSHKNYNCIARVLLVEDSLINQAVLAAMLRKGGHQVDLADCGTQGIEAASEKVYDIILMDVSMPDMSGMEATAIIRQLGGAAATVPIIAITAHALAGYEAMCLAAGMNGYATKPINQKDLLALVDTWSTNKESQTTEVISPC